MEENKSIIENAEKQATITFTFYDKGMALDRGDSSPFQQLIAAITLLNRMPELENEMVVQCLGVAHQTLMKKKKDKE